MDRGKSWANNFYPRPPRGGRLCVNTIFGACAQFLSTPSARRATSAFNGSNNHIRFLSTPSARRATDELPLLDRSPSDFYPRPPRGGRLSLELETDDLMKISIHALREEGDGFQRRYGAVVVLFLSTPSARRATSSINDAKKLLDISIHALREEGDIILFAYSATSFISIHALREEGDQHTTRRRALSK